MAAAKPESESAKPRPAAGGKSRSAGTKTGSTAREKPPPAGAKAGSTARERPPSAGAKARSAAREEPQSAGAKARSAVREKPQSAGAKAGSAVRETPRRGVAPKAQPKAAPAENVEVKGAGEEAKRKFREALERKHNQQGDHGTGLVGPDSSKIHGAQGPAFSRRTFRRKAGS